MTLEPSTDQLQSLSLHEDRKWERKSSCMDASLHGDTATSQHVEAEIWQDLKRCLSLIYLVFFCWICQLLTPPREEEKVCHVWRVQSVLLWQSGADGGRAVTATLSTQGRNRRTWISPQRSALQMLQVWKLGRWLFRVLCQIAAASDWCKMWSLPSR